MLIRLIGTERVAAEMAQLRAAHPAWFATHPGARATYAIPEPVLSGGSLGTLFDTPTMRAERDFTAACSRREIGGVTPNQLMHYPPFTTKGVVVDDAMAEKMGYSAADRLKIRAASVKAQTSHDRILGVAGRLVTEPIFLRDVASLRAAWEALDVRDRPPLPLVRPAPVSTPPADARPAPASVATVADRVAGLLDRWGLVALYDWHLPLPQGPFLASELPPGAPTEPRQGVRIILPVHYPLHGDDDLLQEIARLQRLNAIELGLPAGIGPVKHFKQHAQILRLIHLETVLRSRFAGKPPRGFVGALCSAGAKELDVGPDTVKRLRKWVAKYRAGRRDGIAQLRD